MFNVTYSIYTVALRVVKQFTVHANSLSTKSLGRKNSKSAETVVIKALLLRTGTMLEIIKETSTIFKVIRSY